MPESIKSKPKFFRIPLIAWIILALWSILHIYTAFKVGLNSTSLGMLTGDLLIPLLIPLLITFPIWFLFRRSQRVASITFSILLILIIFSRLSRYTQKSNTTPENKEHIVSEQISEQPAL